MAFWVDPAPGATLSALESGPGSTYTVVDQDLRDLLVEVGGELGFRVTLSEGVRGRVRGRLPGISPEQVIDYLTKLYSLDRYADGSVLYVSSRAEIVSKVFDLGHVRLDDLRAAMDSLGLTDERWPLRKAGGTDLAAMSAPPSYLDLVDQMVSTLRKRPEPAAKQLQPLSITVFRGAIR